MLAAAHRRVRRHMAAPSFHTLAGEVRLRPNGAHLAGREVGKYLISYGLGPRPVPGGLQNIDTRIEQDRLDMRGYTLMPIFDSGRAKSGGFGR